MTDGSLAHAAPPAPPRRRTGLPLAWKLALVMTGLLAAGIAGMLLAVQDTLSDGAESVTRAKLTRTVRDLAERTEASSAPRLAKLRGAARDAAIIGALRAAARSGATAITLESMNLERTPSDSSTVAAARAALATLKLHQPDTAVVELWDASGRPVAALSAPVSAALRERAIPAIARDSVWLSPLRQHGDDVHVWSVVPVDDGATRLGYVANLRWFRGSRSIASQLRSLTGEDVSLYVRNLDGSVWSTAWGEVAEGATARDSTAEGITYLRGGERMVALEARVRGAPWVVVIEVPHRAVLAAPMRTTRRLALLGLAFIVVGALIAWRLGRRMTKPLTALTTAAEEVARGTYEHAVPRGAGNEMDRLSVTFDSMARQVATAHAELERRAADAQEYAAELTRTNARLRDAIGEAERASRAKSDFLAVMSHELRTPLNAIGGYTDLLDMGIYGEVSAEQRDAIVRIGRSQRHLLALIEDVLNYARLEGGQARFDLRDVPLGDVLADVEALVAPQARARDIALEMPPCDPALMVRADADKVRQVVLNLLANAIKFTPVGGTVSVACEARPDTVCVHVADTGPGIPADRLDSIFEPFVQGDRALNRPAEGVGLGLAISRDLARGMSGSLTVRSTPGQGAVFTLHLPYPTAVPAPARDGGRRTPVRTGALRAADTSR